MPNRLPLLIAATKTLASSPKWQEHDDQFNFTVPLETDPGDVAAMVAFMGETFNINGVNAIPAPPWKAPRLL
jgi:hypothetical protein